MKKTDKLKKITSSTKKNKLFDTKLARKLNVSNSSLAYYAKKGDLERVGRGLYKIKNTSLISDFQWEDLVEASVKVKGGVVCLISALALYEITEEIPRAHWIAIPNTSRHRGDDSIRIFRYRNMKLGKTVYDFGDFKLPIFDRERTIIDAFRLLDKEVAIKALRMGLRKKGEARLDLEKLKEYAKILRVRIEPYILAETT
ncbi:MAG: AbiEi antitoxin N-terminal domain-containing protein [Rhizobacter sp.]|nr:AbiEi antitoxin N-terminal domain-containing protein [Bacteriovorax sp.]